MLVSTKQPICKLNNKPTFLNQFFTSPTKFQKNRINQIIHKNGNVHEKIPIAPIAKFDLNAITIGTTEAPSLDDSSDDENVITKKPYENKGKDEVNVTYYPKKIDTDKTQKPWFIINADGQILGRMSTLISTIIRGKLNPAYTSSMDMGGFVVVINCEKVMVSGQKYLYKRYFRHTIGRPGKSKIENFRDLQNRIPERIIEKAVKGMLPKGRLGRRLFHHLKVYKGDGHPHEAQKPMDITNWINKKPSEIYALINE